MKTPDATKPMFQINPSMRARIMMGVCATCPSAIEEKHFRDDLSKKEYAISGMCQDCQDSVFAHYEAQGEG
mgnify:CR=1 FL=1